MSTPRVLLLPLQVLVAIMITTIGTSTPRVVGRKNTKTACPEDWVLYDTLCVKFFDDKKVPWWDAWSHCRNLKESTHLVYLESEREHDRLTGMMANARIDDVWIGLNDLKVSKSFVWVDEESVNYTNYAPNALMEGKEKTKHCVGIQRDVGYMWSVSYCFDDKYFACRKDVA